MFPVIIVQKFTASLSVLISSDRIYLNNDDIKFNTNYINNSVALFSNHYHQMNKKYSIRW